MVGYGEVVDVEVVVCQESAEGAFARAGGAEDVD